MFPLFTFQSRRRDEDEHWYDPDPIVRARNKRFEADLDRVLDDYSPPQRRKDDSDVHPLIRYGVRVGIPSVMASCLVYWLVMKLDTKLDTHTDLMRDHMIASSRTEQLMEKVAALMLVQCVNTATDSDERADCARASR